MDSMNIQRFNVSTHGTGMINAIVMRPDPQIIRGLGHLGVFCVTSCLHSHGDLKRLFFGISVFL